MLTIFKKLLGLLSVRAHADVVRILRLGTGSTLPVSTH